MAECYSCGNEASSDSPRNFCDECDAEFDAGLEHADAVVQRAERLEEAKSADDYDTIGKIIAEIHREAGH